MSFPSRALLVILVLLAAGAALAAPPRKHTRTRHKARPAHADTTRVARPAADTLAAPVDSVALAWADSAVVAHGGSAPWDSLLDLRFKVRVTEYGSGAQRSQVFSRYLKLGPGGPMYRIEARSDSGPVFVFACTPRIAWAYEDDLFLEDVNAVRFARNQLTLDLGLMSLPWRMREPGVRLSDVGQVTEDRREVHLVDLDQATGMDLWRVAIDSATHLVCGASWWHYERGGVPPRTRVELSDYEHVGQLLIPTLRRIYEGDTGRLRSEARFSDFKPNTGLSDSLFLYR